MSYSDAYDREEGIAIIGMAGRFPGARNIAEFWKVLVEGRETLTRFAPDELEPSLLEPAGARSDPNYVRVRGVLEDADKFDAAFFGITPREAEVMDPQQRVMLEVCWHALEDAGIVPGEQTGAVGVYAGAGYNMYLIENLLGRPDVTDIPGMLTTLVGNEHDYLATRVAYKLNLKGPAITVQTACSTSLVAVASAVQALQNFQCDVALAGGVAILLPQRRGYLWQEGSITSLQGHCRPFDESADGTVFGNGAGMVVLKRLREAVAAGDRIYAVIKGAALNNDGSSKVSFTAPSVDGHAEVIAMAQALAGIDPDSIGYIEAHATATSLGDPIEVAGLTQAFRAGGANRKSYCAIGSVKGNFGHLDAAAGVTGLIKTALSLYHGQIPASINYSRPNPKLLLDTSPFFVNDRLREWSRGANSRRAGVSSFGVGGTNAHVVLEEAPGRDLLVDSRPAHLLTLSAKTAASADEALPALAAALEQDPSITLGGVAFTLQKARKAFGERRAVVASSVADAVTALRGAPGRVLRNGSARRPARVAFLFPGQGSQYIGMSRALYEHEPVFRAELDACAEALVPSLGMDIRQVIYPLPDKSEEARTLLVQTRYTQPALFVVEYALAKFWIKLGVRPDAMIGHSIGEFVAAALGGLFTLQDALALVCERARLMQMQPPGAMLSVGLSGSEVAQHLDASVSVAAYNAPQLTVVSGDTQNIDALEAKLGGLGVTAKRVRTSHAFHSTMMEGALPQFRRAVDAVRMHKPGSLWISSLTGKLVAESEVMTGDYWARQLREPVRFSDGVAGLLDADIALLEVGPGGVLTNLRRQHRGIAADQLTLASFGSFLDPGRDYEAFLAACGRLWCEGVDLDWSALHAGESRQVVSLPGYSFERHVHWVEPGKVETEAGMHDSTESPDLDGISECEVDVIDKMSLMVEKLTKLIAELSGLEAASLVPSVPFLELGLDSLFLAQASGAIQKAFGVRVSVRELSEGLDRIDALGARLLELAPDSVAAPSRPPRREPAAAAAPPVRQQSTPLPAQADATGADAIAGVLARQLDLMARQLEILTGGDPNIGKALPARADAAASGSGSPALPAVAAPSNVTKDSKPVAFGPYRPPTKGPTGGLNEKQQAALNLFIRGYNARTGGSKDWTARNRAKLADPRTVAGFRQIWKEIVYPIVTVRSKGSKLWDVDGNQYVDLVNGFGMNLFGHNPDFISDAIRAQIDAGYEIGPQSPLAGEVAELVCEFSGTERAAFCSTGSEAVMAAIRMARTVTGRDRIVMFTGDYHGIFDEVLARPVAVDGNLRSKPIAPGIPESMVENILILEYGRPATLEALRSMKDTVAAVIVEPVQSRRPDLQPREFLKELREVCTAGGSALVFDEVVTGFRSSPGGAQEIFGVRADIVTYGKIVGGGMPIGVVTGAARYLDSLDGGSWRFGDESYPEVGVTFFAGTFVRHPLALASARAVLQRLKSEGPGLQRTLNKRASAFVEEINEHATSLGVPLKLTHFSSMFYFNFPADLPLASLFYPWLRSKGVHIWEGRPGFIGVAHSEADVEFVAQAIRQTLAEMIDADLLPGEKAPVAGARRGRDAQGRQAWFVEDPATPGEFVQVGEASND